MKGAIPTFQAHSSSSGGKLSNSTKIATIYKYLVLRICILRNCCKHCVIIIVLFTKGEVVPMETKFLW